MAAGHRDRFHGPAAYVYAAPNAAQDAGVAIELPAPMR